MANQKIPLYEIHEVAFLSLNNVQVEFEKRGTRVVFLVPATQKVYELLADYNENPKVNLLDFVACLRRIRGKMLSIRDGNENRKWEGEANGNFKK